MTERYQEWASTVKARKGRMLPVEAFKSILKLPDPGYASVYMFNEEDAKKLSDSESSAGMNKMAVGADTLIMDIDSGDEGMEQIGKLLDSKGLRFEVWESGGKGYHIILTHDFVYDKRVPYSHKIAVETLLGPLVKYIDMTLYQHGRLISLPRRVHPITKVRKKLLFKREGKDIEVKLVDEPPKYIPNFSLEASYDKLSSGLFRAAELVRDPPNTGNRHVRLWSTAKSLTEAGLEYETVLNIMIRINESWKNPKQTTEVEAVVRSTFKNQT